MKHQHKFAFIVICALLVLSLMGCGPLAPDTVDPTVATTVPTLATNAPTTPPATTETTIATTPATDPSKPADDGSYVIRIPWRGISVLSDPVYDAEFVCSIDEPGAYTIVEETQDFEGNLWGKLKSGLGWVNVTQINAYHENTPPMLANYASDELLNSGNYHHCIVDTSQYAVKIAFYPTEKLTDVTFYSMVLTENLERDRQWFSGTELTPDIPFVAQVAFPGDMSMYEITFTDADGNNCIYRIGISGRNGTIEFHEVNP